MTQTYRANGKLLLTAEYAVLSGAEALAFPTRYGQTLSVEPGEKDQLQWVSLNHEKTIWFEARFSRDLSILYSSDGEKARHLQNILKAALKLGKKEFLQGQKVVTHLEFPNNWGLGSSSTLIHLIAQWSGCNAMQLFKATSRGSGYDVACAGSQQAIVYTLNQGQSHWKMVQLPVVFNELVFVHLNQKQKSEAEVKRYEKSKHFDPAALSEKATALTQRFLQAQTTAELGLAMNDHENLMAPALQLPKVKDLLFPDFNGSIKSMGAWGGDFVMALGENAPDYFKDKGYPTVFTLNELIVSNL